MAKLTEVVVQGKFLRLAPLTLPESKQLRLSRLFPGSLYKAASSTVLVALTPSKTWNPSKSAPSMVDTSLLAWVIEAVNQLSETPKVSPL